MRIIRGELAFENGPGDIAGAAVHVRVEDVSRADDAAVTVAEWSNPALPRGTTTSIVIPFEVPVESLDPRGRYSLRAHVDVDRDGQTSIGDFITMEEFPLQRTGPDFYRLRVRRVE
jgi:uncharacterized lipoprotein YbaY